MADAGEISEIGDAARQSSEELRTLTSQTNQASAAIQGLSGAQKNAASAAEAAAAKEKALGVLYNQLNQILPGLGSAMEVLAAGYKSTAVAAETATVAQEGFIASAGPLAVVVLAIQEAMNLWDHYQRKVDATAAAVSESMKKIEDATREALDAQIAFTDAMNAGPSAAQKIANSLNYNNTILDAQTEKQRKAIEQQEQQELNGAQTEDGRAAIRTKYQQQNNDLDQKTAAQKIQNEQQALQKDEDEESKENAQLADLKKKQADADKKYRDGDKNAYALYTDLQKQIAPIQDSLKELHGAEQNYQADLATQEGIYQVNYGSLPAVPNASIPSSVASSNNSPVASHPAPPSVPTESPTHQSARQDVTTLDQFGEILNSGGTLNKSQTDIATNIVSALEGHVASSKETMAFLSRLATITGTLSTHNNTINSTIAQLDQRLTEIQQHLSNHGP